MPNAKATQLHVAPGIVILNLAGIAGAEQGTGAERGAAARAGDGSFMFELMHFMCTSIFPYLYLQSFAVNILPFFPAYPVAIEIVK